MENSGFSDPWAWALLVVYVATLAHVLVESVRDKRVGSPFVHVFLVAVVAWPLGYLLWILVWPGRLRQWLFGSDAERIRRRVEERFAKIRAQQR